VKPPVRTKPSNTLEGLVRTGKYQKFNQPKIIHFTHHALVSESLRLTLKLADGG